MPLPTRGPEHPPARMAPAADQEKGGSFISHHLELPSEVGPRGRSAALRSSPSSRGDYLGADEETAQDDAEEEDHIFGVDHAARHVLEALGDADVLEHVPRGPADDCVGEDVAEPETE